MSPSFFENKNYWTHELKNINSNMPQKRISLTELLKQEKKSYLSKDGQQPIQDSELEQFRKFFSSDMYDKISIPVVLLQTNDHYVTSGNKYDIWVVERLMGHDPDLSAFILSIKDYKPKFTYYYSYQVNRIKRKFPTIVQIIYSMS